MPPFDNFANAYQSEISNPFSTSIGIVVAAIIFSIFAVCTLSLTIWQCTCCGGNSVRERQKPTHVNEKDESNEEEEEKEKDRSGQKSKKDEGESKKSRKSKKASKRCKVTWADVKVVGNKDGPPENAKDPKLDELTLAVPPKSLEKEASHESEEGSSGGGGEHDGGKVPTVFCTTGLSPPVSVHLSGKESCALTKRLKKPVSKSRSKSKSKSKKKTTGATTRLQQSKMTTRLPKTAGSFHPSPPGDACAASDVLRQSKAFAAVKGPMSQICVEPKKVPGHAVPTQRLKTFNLATSASPTTSKAVTVPKSPIISKSFVVAKTVHAPVRPAKTVRPPMSVKRPGSPPVSGKRLTSPPTSPKRPTSSTKSPQGTKTVVSAEIRSGPLGPGGALLANQSYEIQPPTRQTKRSPTAENKSIF